MFKTAVVYLARHEIASANIEQLLFDNIPNVRENKPGSTSIDDGMAAREVINNKMKEGNEDVLPTVRPKP